MERKIGTVSRGVRCPIIREGDDLAAIVSQSVLSAAEAEGFALRDRDVIAVTAVSYTHLIEGGAQYEGSQGLLFRAVSGFRRGMGNGKAVESHLSAAQMPADAEKGMPVLSHGAVSGALHQGN